MRLKISKILLMFSFAAIGQYCSYDTDCFHSRYNGTEQAMYCSARECKCAVDYEEDRDSRFCIQSSKSYLFFKCHIIFHRLI